MHAVSLDFETYYKEKDGLGIKKQGMATYVRDARFDAYLISVSDGTDTWAGRRQDFNWEAIDGCTLLSHNAAFDSAVYAELVKRGQAPQIQIPHWHCTANLSTYLCMRRSLDKAADFLLGVHLDKSTRGKADGKTWDDLVAEDGGKEMLAYARRDALYCWQIWDKFNHLWPDIEKRISDLTIRQGARGVQIDIPKLDRFYEIATKMRWQAEQVLPWMEYGRAPTSTKGVAEECRKHGIPCPPVKSRDGEEAYDEWVSTYAPKFKWVKAYSDYRKIDKFITTLETIKSRLFDEGIFPFDLLYFGAHTGRWAGGGGFNMQNMRKEPLYFDEAGWLITDNARLLEIEFELSDKGSGKLPAYVAHALDLRALFIARPGRKMIISDLSQIEPRVLAWLVKDFDMLNRMSSGASPYQAHAEATMGWTEGELKKKNKDLYALAKARVLGLGYGCGWKKFITVAYDMANLDVTANDPEFVQATNKEGLPCFNKDGTPVMVSGYGSFSRKCVEEFRAQNPLIVGLWKSLDEGFKDSVGGDFEIEMPSGRSLRYADVRWERKAVPDEERPGKFTFKRVCTALAFDQKQQAVVRKSFYGGLLCENLTQALARDVFAMHLLSLDDAGMNPLWSVHDEAVTECHPSTSAKDVQDVMSVAPPWMPGLPVAAEAKEAKHYLK